MQFFKFLPAGLALTCGALITQTSAATPEDKNMPEVHRRALEVLHNLDKAGGNAPATTGLAQPMTDREAEGRTRLLLHEQQRSLDQGKPRTYEQDLEARTRAMMGGNKAGSAAAATDSQPNVEVRARELLRQREMEEKKKNKKAVAAEESSGASESPNAAVHAKALRVLRQQETQPAANVTESPAPTATTSTAPTTAPAVEPAPAVTIQPNTAAARPAPAPAKTSVAKESKPAPAAKSAAKNNEAEKKPAKKSSPTATATTTQTPEVVVTPAAPRTKREKLADLLEQYKADKLNPVQYQEERAKILAEP